MASFHVIGNSLVEPEELFLKNISGESSNLRTIDLRTSDLNFEFAASAVPLRELSTLNINRDFSPIGIGKPLSIEIATVYTGQYKKFLGGKKDVVVVSGVKNATTFSATSRAINIKSENVNENDFLKFAAFDDGTPIVYYSPAFDAERMVVTFEIMFDNFDTKIFETIAGLLNSAAGIPVFMPAAAFLLGGSQLINIGSKLGDTIFSGRPNLSGSVDIQFLSPVIPPTEPREYVIYNEKDKNEFENLKVGLVEVGGNKELRLLNKSDDTVYTGSAPYLIVILNGLKRQDLESFAPTLASAAILKKFYGSQDQAGEITTALQSAMQLYNDSNYRSKGDRLKKQLDKLSKDSEEFKKLKILYDAYAENIQNDNLKLPNIES